MTLFTAFAPGSGPDATLRLVAEKLGKAWNQRVSFEPVASIFRTTFLIAVPTDSKFKNLGDIVAAAKVSPGTVTYGSWGVGSPGHLGAELLELQTGIQMQHIAYREVSQLFMSVGAGDVTWSLGTLPSSSGAFKAGKLRYIAVASGKRLSQVPEVPTALEAGGPKDFDVNAFVVLVSPKGLALALRAKINAA